MGICEFGNMGSLWSWAIEHLGNFEELFHIIQKHLVQFHLIQKKWILHFIQTSQVLVQKIKVFFGSTPVLKIIWSKNRILFPSKKVSKGKLKLINYDVQKSKAFIALHNLCVEYRLSICMQTLYKILFVEVWWLSRRRLWV